MYETFEHTADLGLRAAAADLEALFAEAAVGLMSIIVANLDEVRPVQQKEFSVAGSQPDELLFDWLSELLYVFETEHLLLAKFDVRLGPAGLHATGRGELLDHARHQLEHEVKAITYHGLQVERSAGVWKAEVIVDI